MSFRQWVAIEFLPLAALLAVPSILDFVWWIDALIIIAMVIVTTAISVALRLRFLTPDAANDSESNAPSLALSERSLQTYVRFVAPVLTAAMFAVLLISQQPWVEFLERPRWVDAATGIAVIGWIIGAVVVALGFPKAPWILVLASVSGLIAQWGDTLGGEVGFDMTFYLVQGLAIASHLIFMIALAFVPPADQRDDVPVPVPIR